MASFSLNNSEVVRLVLQITGLGRDPSVMDAPTEADVRAVIRSGLRRFLWPIVENSDSAYQWRWLEKFHAIPAEAKFDDGTVAVSAGTVTLTGGTWPSDLTNYFILVDGHTLFVTERLGDTTATVSHTQLTVAAATEYEAFKYRYDLPSDFGEWLGGVLYTDATSSTSRDSRFLAGSDESEIRLRYAVGQGQNTKTTHYAITSTPEGDGFSIVLWPVPEPDAFIQGVYLRTPDDNLPADLTTPGVVVQVAPIYAEAALEAILSAAEEYNHETQGIHGLRFESALKRAILHDKAIGGDYDFSQPIRDRRGHGEVLPIDFTDALL